ncbi:SctD/MshK family protein [Bradyrhizobium yuanmingense]|uniref:SctD/MshK family protein n=1 Tax=Bradyrhizobium yuanmingense TaxID=108015 RepID=UPI0023B96F78|nr:EscD/YscD/HrpQ family type III secretion system periplasmic domain-containing protein [Bradyrhizobium yuanmingense]MDF0497178.1 EscD/YscD/HrpQ family type III secretion system periplasmic domain-containing protein [Bradyrhizobium yuanmingense]
MNEPNSLHFEVLSGLYSGLTGEIGLGSTLIGSDLDADLVFIEQGLERHHLRITPHCDSIQIEPLARDVRIEGREQISLSERVIVPLPVVIHAGEMSIRCSMEESKQASSVGRWYGSAAVLASVLISSVAVGAVSTSFVQTDSAVAVNSDLRRTVEVATKQAPSTPDAPTADAAAARLQEEVDRAGLLDIKVRSESGVVAADGTVTRASLTKWREVQERFDHDRKGAYVLINAVAVKEEKSPTAISVEAVWRGSEPYVVIAGQKYFVGAMLNNGWTVNGIDERRVLLSRNGRLVAVPY